MRRLVLALLLCVAGCTQAASITKPIKPVEVKDIARRGDAPLDEMMKHVRGARASWFANEGEKRMYVLEIVPKKAVHTPLLLLHGIGDTGLKDFFPVIEALAKGRHLIAMDMPGFGYSERDDDNLVPERLANRIASIVRELGVTRLDVLGHSSGGSLALQYAAQDARVVRRVVLVGVVGILRPETLLRSQLHENLNDMREERPVASKMVEKSGDAVVNVMSEFVPSAGAIGKLGLSETSPGLALAFKLLDYNFAPAIASVRAPTLLLWGKTDDVSPIRIGDLLHDRLQKSELEFLADAGHVAMKDQPAAFEKAVLGYLDGPLKKPPQRAKEKSGLADARCKDQEDYRLTGDFDLVELTGCKHAWLHEVRARRVVVKDSEDVRFDHVDVHEGVVADESSLVITGGTLEGDIALDLSGGDHDVAGVKIDAKKASIHVRSPTTVLFSVSHLQSPSGVRILHEKRKMAGGDTL